MDLKHSSNSALFHFSSIRNGALSAVPMFADSVPAGFPSPAEDYMDLDLNLHDYLIKNPSSTFFVRASGESMSNTGIRSGDIMLVDRSLNPKNRSIVLAVLDGEFTVKRVNISNNEIYLMSENENGMPIRITTEMEFQVWGIVTYIIHKAL